MRGMAGSGGVPQRQSFALTDYQLEIVDCSPLSILASHALSREVIPSPALARKALNVRFAKLQHCCERAYCVSSHRSAIIC